MNEAIDPAKFAEAVEKVRDLQDKHARAERDTNSARCLESSLFNQLNEAQKALDTLLENIRAGAPHDSHWKNRDRKNTSFEVMK